MSRTFPNINFMTGLRGADSTDYATAANLFNQGAGKVQGVIKDEFTDRVDKLTDKALNDILNRDTLDTLGNADKTSLLESASPYVDRTKLANAFDTQRDEVQGIELGKLNNAIASATTPEEVDDIRTQLLELGSKGIDVSSNLSKAKDIGEGFEEKRNTELLSSFDAMLAGNTDPTKYAGIKESITSSNLPDAMKAQALEKVRKDEIADFTESTEFNNLKRSEQQRIAKEGFQGKLDDYALGEYADEDDMITAVKLDPSYQKMSKEDQQAQMEVLKQSRVDLSDLSDAQNAQLTNLQSKAKVQEENVNRIYEQQVDKIYSDLKLPKEEVEGSLDLSKALKVADVGGDDEFTKYRILADASKHIAGNTNITDKDLTDAIIKSIGDQAWFNPADYDRGVLEEEIGKYKKKYINNTEKYATLGTQLTNLGELKEKALTDINRPVTNFSKVAKANARKNRRNILKGTNEKVNYQDSTGLISGNIFNQYAKDSQNYLAGKDQKIKVNSEEGKVPKLDTIIKDNKIKMSTKEIDELKDLKSKHPLTLTRLQRQRLEDLTNLSEGNPTVLKQLGKYLSKSNNPAGEIYRSLNK